MAAVTIRAVGTALAANAAAIGVTTSLTTANITALAALVTLLGNKPAEALPLLKLLSDTNRAELFLNS